VVSPAITMYTTGWCPYCARARALLERKGVRWAEIDVESEPERRAEMIARSGRRTVPQIFIDDRPIGGSDELHELDHRGELDALLTPHDA
jgi:glutaredoxin 3